MGEWWGNLVDWSTTERWAIIITLVLAAVGWANNRNAANSAAGKAEAAAEVAERSARAAEMAAKVQERMAVALEAANENNDRTEVDIERIREVVQAELAASKDGEKLRADLLARYVEQRTGIARRGGTWIVEQTGPGRFNLTNGSARTAFNVRVEANGAVALSGFTRPLGQIPAGETQAFLADVNWQTETPKIKVTWSSGVGEPDHVWERLLP